MNLIMWIEILNNRINELGFIISRSHDPAPPKKILELNQRLLYLVTH